MLRSGRITVNRRSKAPDCCDILSTRQADVAQQVEQLTRNEQVSGSSPLVGSLVLCLPLPNAPCKGKPLSRGGFLILCLTLAEANWGFDTTLK